MQRIDRDFVAWVGNQFDHAERGDEYGHCVRIVQGKLAAGEGLDEIGAWITRNSTGLVRQYFDSLAGIFYKGDGAPEFPASGRRAAVEN